jgi:hypothetical protein
VVDGNLRRLQGACRERGIDLRVHFKSKKWQSARGCPRRRPISSVHAESWPTSASTPAGAPSG